VTVHRRNTWGDGGGVTVVCVRAYLGGCCCCSSPRLNDRTSCGFCPRPFILPCHAHSSFLPFTADGWKRCFLRQSVGGNEWVWVWMRRVCRPSHPFPCTVERSSCVQTHVARHRAFGADVAFAPCLCARCVACQMCLTLFVLTGCFPKMSKRFCGLWFHTPRRTARSTTHSLLHTHSLSLFHPHTQAASTRRPPS
jgi:hypothetical protein